MHLYLSFYGTSNVKAVLLLFMKLVKGEGYLAVLLSPN